MAEGGKSETKQKMEEAKLTNEELKSMLRGETFRIVEKVREAEKLEEQISKLEESVKLIEEMQEEEKPIKELFEELELKIKDLRKELAKVEKERESKLEESDKIIQKIQEEEKLKKTQISKLEERVKVIEEIRKEEKPITEQFEESVFKIEKLQEELAKVCEKLSSTREERDKILEKWKLKEEQLSTLQESVKIKELREELSKVREELSSTREERDKITQKMDEEKMKHRISTLEESVEMKKLREELSKVRKELVSKIEERDKIPEKFREEEKLKEEQISKLEEVYMVIEEIRKEEIPNDLLLMFNETRKIVEKLEEEEKLKIKQISTLEKSVQIKDLRKELAKVAKEARPKLEERDKILKNLEEEKELKEGQISKLESIVQVIGEEEKPITEQFEELVFKIDKLQEELATVQKELESKLEERVKILEKFREEEKLKNEQISKLKERVKVIEEKREEEKPVKELLVELAFKTEKLREELANVEKELASMLEKREEIEKMWKEGKLKTELRKSRLDERIKALIELITDELRMEQVVAEMKYDPRKVPLGELTDEQVRNGYLALKEIKLCIVANETGQKLIDACNKYYTRIPHDFGERKPPLITTEDQLEKEQRLLEVLEDIHLTLTILKVRREDVHPCDSFYNSLNCRLEPLDPSDEEYEMINSYLLNTHAETHNKYNLEIIDAFKCTREEEVRRFKDYGNRKLLWHGSRLTNWASILKQGLCIAPPDAPKSGYMFGKGIYFADRSSKSARYCSATKSRNEGLLALCEVSLGNCNELVASDCNARQLPEGKHSVHALGSTAPDPRSEKILPDGVVVPMGKGIETGVKNPNGYTLLYNEYIVYDVCQVKIRYLLRVKFNYK